MGVLLVGVDRRLEYYNTERPQLAYDKQAKRSNYIIDNYCANPGAA